LSEAYLTRRKAIIKRRATITHSNMFNPVYDLGFSMQVEVKPLQNLDSHSLE